MEVISTPSCLCCGVAASDYLEHLLELHKFSLARARGVIGADAIKKPSGPKATEGNIGSMDNSASVLRVGEVPITLPSHRQGGPIHIHLNIGNNALLEEQQVKGLVTNYGDEERRISPSTTSLELSSQEVTMTSVGMSSTPASERATGDTIVDELKTECSDDEIVILDETSNRGKIIAPNLSKSKIPKNPKSKSKKSKVVKEPDEVMTSSYFKPSSFYSKKRKRKQIDNGSKRKKSSRLSCLKPQANQDTFSEGREMMKYNRLTELLDNGEVHCCKICLRTVQNTKRKIHDHAVNIHGINILQYCALYFKKKSWSWHNVSTGTLV